MSKYLLVILFVAAASAQIADIRFSPAKAGGETLGTIAPKPGKCSNAEADVSSVTITDCTSLPCKVDKNSEIQVNFKPKYTSANGVFTIKFTPKSGNPVSLPQPTGRIDAGADANLKVTINDGAAFKGDVVLNVLVVNQEGKTEVCQDFALVYGAGTGNSFANGLSASVATLTASLLVGIAYLFK